MSTDTNMSTYQHTLDELDNLWRKEESPGQVYTRRRNPKGHNTQQEVLEELRSLKARIESLIETLT